MTSRHLNFMGWIVFLLILYFLSKSKTGHAVIYYALVLILIFLVTRNAPIMLKDFTTGGTQG